MDLPNNHESRVLVLEPDEELAASIQNALREAAPDALVEMAHDLSQDFLYDLRTSHPNARAIILTGIHLAAHREQAAGLGAIHFLEKPFPHAEFVDLVRALLRPAGEAESEKFQGSLRDLYIADIIQLKCMSGATSTVEFTGPRGEKGDPGPSGPASGIRVVKADCDARGCTVQCRDDEMLLTAYCGPRRNAAVIPSERSATCRNPVPANNPLVAACVKMLPQ